MTRRPTRWDRAPAVALSFIGLAMLGIALFAMVSLFNDQAEAEKVAKENGVYPIVGVTPLDSLPPLIIVAVLGGVLIVVGILLWFLTGKTVKV